MRQLRLARRTDRHGRVRQGRRGGVPGQGLFVMLMGSVEVLRGGQPLARLGAGDLFGEMALLHDGPTNATVRTLGPTSLLFLGRDYFRRLVGALPALRKYFEE